MPLAMQEGAGVWKTRGGLQASTCFPAPGHANGRGGPARTLLEIGVLSAEGSLPEEGNDAHRPVGKGEWTGKRIAPLPLEVKCSLLLLI